MSYNGDSFKKEFDENGELIDPEGELFDRLLKMFTGSKPKKNSNHNMNKFGLLCTQASKFNWCWDINCTTCGCYDFKAGFYAIAHDKPIDEASINKIKKDCDLVFNDESIQSIVEIASKADLFEINKSCKFPDWLGYIGLLYHLFSGFGRYAIMRELTKSYCPQFIKMVKEDSRAHKILNEIIKSNYKIDFSIDMLEEIEFGINF